MVPLRYFAFLIAFTCLAGSAGAAEGIGARDEAFLYPLRAGESLSDVSRIFRVPVAELLERNRIADPDRLSVGQVIVVPNAFARELAALRAERTRLLAAGARMEQQHAASRARFDRLERQLADLEEESASLEAALAQASHWQVAAKALCFVLLVAFAWGLKARSDRATMLRRLRRTAAENIALTTVKEKYREAVSQLELRYQKLYRGHGETPRDVVADGTARLARAFNEGTLQIERLLRELGADSPRNEPPHAGRRSPGWLLHPLREILERQRLHHRTP